jgi:DNA polymerase I
MKIEFQLLDSDYIFTDSPKIRIFGKTEDGIPVCIFFSNYYPYFYVLPKSGKEKRVIEFLKKNFKNLILNIEKVEKFLPIGYSDKTEELLKITLKDPKKVPTIREALRDNENVKETFEADILFKYRFMADYNLSALHWYAAEGRYIKTNSVNSVQTIEAKSFKEVEEKPSKFKFLAIDIEVATKEGLPDSRKDQIAMISLAFHPPFKGRKSMVLISRPFAERNIISFQNEKEMLNGLIKIFNEYDPDFIVGYNINNFDLPYIVDRMRANRIRSLLGRARDKGTSSREFRGRRKNRIPGRIIVDVYEILKEFASKGSLRMKRYGLGDVAKELIDESKIDVAHSEIYELWRGGREDIKKLINYTRKDAELVLRILIEKGLLDKFVEISKVSGLLLQDVLDMGESARVENLLLREFNKRGFIIPNKPSGKEYKRREAEREVKGLKGALVLEPAIGLHRNIVYLDFKAMYPSILISFNICPTTYLTTKKVKDYITTPYGVRFVSKKLREGIIPQIVSELIKERDRIKKEMRACKDEWKKRMLDAKQYALKVMTLAFWGYMGYMRARFYILDVANAITSCGRELIKKTKEIAEKTGKYSVIYGDTDSIMVHVECENIEEAFRKGKEVERLINKEMKGIVRMKIEGVFKSLLILSKKRYAGLAIEMVDSGYEEKLVMKGIETVRRDWCDLTTETLYKVLDIVLKEQNPSKAFDFVKEILKKLEKNEIPIEKLVITKSISKPIRQYKGIQPHVELVKKMKRREKRAPGVGDRVSYVIVAGPQLISKRAEDPNYVVKHNLKIDAKYYIESQILPPLERVFEVLGISKTQLIGVGKQLVLGEIFRRVKKPKEVTLNFECFICDKCNMLYRRIPLSGKCWKCNGGILFYYNGEKSKQLILS